MPPVEPGSGKFGTPCERMQSENLKERGRHRRRRGASTRRRLARAARESAAGECQPAAHCDEREARTTPTSIAIPHAACCMPPRLTGT